MPSRRGFLVGVGGAVGVAVGFALWPREWPHALVPGDGETAMNAWIRVGADGRVTVTIPQAEMGQGTWSSLAQIVADELGADWRMMAVEPARLHPAYAHRWLAEAASADLPPVVRDVAAYVGATLIERFDVQITAGSTSIRGYERPLREAAAVARNLLILAAARQWRVSSAVLDTVGGAVVYKANRMTFADAARLANPKDASRPIRLRADSQQRLVGKPLLRLDIPPKVDGGARFGGDVRVPDMLYAAIRHGPVGNGRLVSASAPDGVRLVRGDNWVATVGITNWEARRALGKVAARFEGAGGRLAGPWMNEALENAARGDDGVEVAARGTIAPPGARGIEAAYQLPFLAHAAMEPMVATARIDGGRVEIWGPTQSLTLATRAVARALDIGHDDVILYPTLIGGGHGRALEADCMVEAALIARAIKAPVQLCWSRGEDMASGVFRPAAAAYMRADLDADGAIAAFDMRIAMPDVADSFATRHFPGLPALLRPGGRTMAGADDMPYAAGALRVRHMAPELPVPLGHWRGGSHGITAFFVESFIDELATSAGKDPLLYRHALLAAMPRHRALLDAVAREAQWGEEMPAGFGRGVAIHASFGSIVAMVVEAGVNDGMVRISRVTSAVDCGIAINPDSVRAQIEGAAIMGLSAALDGEITFADGYAVQRDFDSYPVMRLADMPACSTLVVESGAPIGGISEAGIGPAAPALANALAAATGRRARRLPLRKFYAG